MKRAIRFQPSNDFLRLYIAEHKKSGGIDLRLCTLNCLDTAILEFSNEYHVLLKHLSKCMNNAPRDIGAHVTVWVFDGVHIRTQRFFNRKQAIGLLQFIYDLTEGKPIVAFEVKHDDKNPDHHWLFIAE